VKFRIVVASALLLLESQAIAKASFTSLVDVPLIEEGGAGIKQDLHGIAVWIGGLPHGRIEVIGTVSDGKRYILLSKKPPVSKEIAELALTSGGNALIAINDPMPLLDKDAIASVVASRRESFAMNQDDGTNKTPTTFLVVKHIGTVR
jgi:hypothetical protein